MRALFSFFLLIFLTSCAGIHHKAGYRVRIHIDQDAKPTVNDVAMITDYLDQTTYETVKTKKQGAWVYESYRIRLNEEKFNMLKRRYIGLGVEYYFVEESANGENQLKKIVVGIANTWEGNVPILKTEIDFVADQIIDKLKKRFGESNFTVERKFVTPM